MGAAALEVAHYRIAPEDIAAESSRLTQALADAQQELLLLADTLPADAPRELGAMLNVTACCWATRCWPSRRWR